MKLRKKHTKAGDSVAGEKPTADEIFAYIDKVSATTPHSIRSSIFDEVTEICELRGWMG